MSEKPDGWKRIVLEAALVLAIYAVVGGVIYVAGFWLVTGFWIWQAW